MAINFLDSISVGTSTISSTTSNLYLLNLTRTTTSLTTAGNVGINGATSVDSPLDIAAASTGNNALFQKWYYSPNAETYYLQLKQTVTSGVVRYNFSMVNNSTAYNDVLVLDRGKVGIGTTDPAKLLDVAGDITFGTTNKFQSGVNNLEGVGANGVYLRSAISSAANPSFSNSDDTNTGMFLPGSDVLGLSTAGSERFRITSAGNVGIGTNNPSERLEVSGSVKATGYKTSSGSGVTTNVTVRNQNNSGTRTFQIVGGIIVGVT